MRLALSALFCLPLAAQSLSADKQAAMGRQIGEEIRRTTKPVESQEVQYYVASLGAKLAAQSPGGRFTFSVVSTENDNVLHEPLAIPGGYIFVPTNLLLAASDEAEFAGMLAQAIARGPVLIPINPTTIPVFTGVANFTGDTLLVGAMQWRRAEIPADKSAALAMSRAGFDPAALLRFIERLQSPDSPRSPFPPRSVRIAALSEAIRKIPPAAYAQSDEFQNMQERVRPPPPKPRTPPSLMAK